MNIFGTEIISGNLNYWGSGKILTPKITLGVYEHKDNQAGNAAVLQINGVDILRFTGGDARSRVMAIKNRIAILLQKTPNLKPDVLKVEFFGGSEGNASFRVEWGGAVLFTLENKAGNAPRAAVWIANLFRSFYGNNWAKDPVKFAAYQKLKKHIEAHLNIIAKRIIEKARKFLGVHYGKFAGGYNLDCQGFVAASLTSSGINYSQVFRDGLKKKGDVGGAEIIAQLCPGKATKQQHYGSYTQLIAHLEKEFALVPGEEFFGIFNLGMYYKGNKGHVGFVYRDEKGNWWVMHSGGYTGGNVHVDPLSKLFNAWQSRGGSSFTMQVGEMVDAGLKVYQV